MDKAAIFRKAFRISQTTLSPYRAILIECAMEAARDPGHTSKLTSLYERLRECAAGMQPLLPDTACVAAVISHGREQRYARFPDGESFINECAAMPADAVRFAALDSATLSSVTAQRFNGTIDNAFDNMIAETAAGTGTIGEDPFFLYIGTGADETEAENAMFSALFESESEEASSFTVSERERRVSALIARSGKAIISCKIRALPGEYASIMAAHPFVNPGFIPQEKT